MKTKDSVVDRRPATRPWDRLLMAREYDPFSCLGPARDAAGWRIRVFRPGAAAVALETPSGTEAFGQWMR